MPAALVTAGDSQTLALGGAIAALVRRRRVRGRECLLANVVVRDAQKVIGGREVRVQLDRVLE
jgi:hypothetical protein